MFQHPLFKRAQKLFTQLERAGKVEVGGHYSTEGKSLPWHEATPRVGKEFSRIPQLTRHDHAYFEFPDLFEGRLTPKGWDLLSGISVHEANLKVDAFLIINGV